MCGAYTEVDRRVHMVRAFQEGQMDGSGRRPYLPGVEPGFYHEGYKFGQSRSILPKPDLRPVKNLDSDIGLKRRHF